MDDAQRQVEKERAVLLALRQGMALIRRGLEIHGMRTDGSVVLIAQTSTYDDLWRVALRTLEQAPTGSDA